MAAAEGRVRVTAWHGAGRYISRRTGAAICRAVITRFPAF